MFEHESVLAFNIWRSIIETGDQRQGLGRESGTRIKRGRSSREAVTLRHGKTVNTMFILPTTLLKVA